MEKVLLYSIDSSLSSLNLVLLPNNKICDNRYGLENYTDEDEYEENFGEDIGGTTRGFNLYANVNA